MKNLIMIIFCLVGRISVAGPQPPTAHMADVLNAQMSLGAKPIETLSATEARLQPTVADGLQKVLAKEKRVPDLSGLETSYNTEIKTVAGSLRTRIYKPAGKNLPVIVYFHGGGWVIADLDVYEGSAFALAKKSDQIVVAVEYRKAPEHKFPAAHDDAVASYRWVLANAKSFGGDPRRVSVAGESAGGNLAINVAIAARDQHFQRPKSIVAIYPVVGTDMTTESYKQYAQAKPLNKPMMEWFMAQALSSPAQVNDPRLNLLAADVRGLPETTIIAAEIDALRTEGEAFAAKLKKAGVKTNYRKFAGVTHEFFGLADAVDEAKDAQNFVVEHLCAK